MPDGWLLVPPGDAALSRRIKAAGDHYVMAEKKRPEGILKGVWTSAATVERIRAEFEAERYTDGFVKKKEGGRRGMPVEEGAGFHAMPDEPVAP